MQHKNNATKLIWKDTTQELYIPTYLQQPAFHKRFKTLVLTQAILYFIRILN